MLKNALLVTASIIVGAPDQLCKRAGVFLLLPLFAKQIEYCLSI